MSTCSTGLSQHERRRQAHVEPLVVAPRQACAMLCCGLSTFYEEILPHLDSYVVGRSRRITVASIREFIKRKLEQEREGAAA
jgi:hypothetical protein